MFLFDDTVRENIRHARPTATDREVEAACRDAGCDGFVEKLEKGLEKTAACSPEESGSGFLSPGPF